MANSCGNSLQHPSIGVWPTSGRLNRLGQSTAVFSWKVASPTSQPGGRLISMAEFVFTGWTQRRAEFCTRACWRDRTKTWRAERDLGFFVLGANSDVLVSEGGFVYMRQKKMTPELEEIDIEVLSDKGAQDVGLHVFSTSGLLDDSWYNRTFWMYSKRWPGFQLANQAPKTGQLLVVDDQKTYAVRVFYRRNVHSPMFFPGKEGYLLFADANTNEPQIVGEPGSRTTGPLVAAVRLFARTR